MGELAEKHFWWIVAAIVALGLALRLAAAQGGLWLDEAWSALMAQQAGTPLGVFLHINHDNNHHLNTLWLQFVGLASPPWLQRALSITTGTATIVIGALIGARRNPATAIVAALLFALSPILVTYGSEARGYAPMLLALMTGVLLIDRWLVNPDAPAPAIPLALIALLGLLSQLTMAFGLAALGLASGWLLWKSLGSRQATIRLAAAFAPAAIVSIAMVAGIYFAAHADGGFTFGAVEPFTVFSWWHGVRQLLDFTIGNGFFVLFALWVAVSAQPVARKSDTLGPIIALGFAFLLVPLLLQLPNAGAARYYLLPAIAILLVFALLMGDSLTQGRERWPGLTALAVLVAPMLWLDWTIIADQRADPARALATIATRASTGADAAVERPRSEAILIAAAASARYPLAIRQACPAARFLFIERDGAEPFPANPIHCHARYREIAGDTVQGLSGTQWKLYERSAR